MKQIETIPELLAECVESFGDGVALREHGSDANCYTYRRLGRAAAVVAGRLAKMGVGKGSPVGLLCENRCEWAVVYFAIHLAGAVCVPIDDKLTAGEIGNILKVSRMRQLICSRTFGELARRARRGRRRIATETLEELVDALPAGEDDGPKPATDRTVGPDEPAVISFTSGTTGTSKGIVLTHRNLAANALAGAKRMGVTEQDRLLSILPLHHLLEQTGGMLVPLASGASVTYAGSLNPRNMAEVMRESRTTIVLVVPALARLLRKRILAEVRSRSKWQRAMFAAGLRLSRAGRKLRTPLGRMLFREVRREFGGELRFFICGGAPLDGELARFFFDVGIPILQGYGLSEASPIVSCNTLDEHVIQSVGRPLPGVEVKIGPAGDGGDGEGEILVRGPSVMAGYFEDQAATDEAIRDGWLHTGDLGTIDGAGYLHVVGRLKDVIVAASGKNVYPDEVEAEIVRCPYVRDACVIGLPAEEGPDRGEEVVALIVPDADALVVARPGEGRQLLREGLQRACEALARYKRPQRFAVWPDEFPRTTTMKLKKFAIRKRLEELDLQPL